MTEHEAAWVREHVWTHAMRRSPGPPVCACQYGPSGYCLRDAHERCGRGTPLRAYEALVCGPDGVSPLAFGEPYAHETDTSATGPRHTTVAMVWLADRVCRWICPCTCGHSAQDALF